MNSQALRDNAFNISGIIENHLIANFQTIISLSRKSSIGLEGLIRGINPYTGETISPAKLFEMAHEASMTLELDRKCRDKVIAAFGDVYKTDKTKLLFLNIDASILDIAEGSNYLLNQVKEHGINPRNVIIEINESKVYDIEALIRFRDTYKKLGFMIALDDVGTGFSNIDRILVVKPDIIKIDVSLIKEINIDFNKQGVINSLVNFANMIGALVIAEGVENENEAIQILRLGCHMMQGFYLDKPCEINQDMLSNERVEILSNSFKEYMAATLREEKKKNKQLNFIVSKCIKELTKVSSSAFDNLLLNITWQYKNIECVYILDEQGIQISNTVRYGDENNVKDNLIYYSARTGTDHSMKKYYYPLVSARLDKYITEPYVSLATGNLCITISKIFKNIENKKFILCIDFNTTDYTYDLESTKKLNMSNLVFNINGKSISEINQIISQMNKELIKDSLTNTYNRRYMEERLLVDIFNAANENQQISIILSDIDFFKNVNDTYGHPAGDYILKEFAKIAQKNIRKHTDWIARYGGEEFLIVLLNSNEKAAFFVAEKIRKEIENAEIVYNKETIKITASFGVCTSSDKTTTYEQLLNNADKNLYLAKNTGRNKTVV